MISTDRSRIETWFRCPRKRYLNYHFEGKGVVPKGSSQDLWFGKVIHARVEALTANRSAVVEPYPFTEFDVTADGLPQRDEWLALADGLMRVFKEFTLPQILDEYDWIGSEVEIDTDLAPDVRLMSRLDGILRRKSDGVYFVLETKTSSWLERLQQSASTNFQLLLECEALRQSLPDDAEIGGAILLVFDKGRRSKVQKGEGYRRVSPFTYAYNRTRADGSEEFELDYKKGFTRVPTWTMPNWYERALLAWPNTVAGSVQVWPSVDFNQPQVDSVIRQVVALERRNEHELHRPSVDGVWPQNFANCQNDGGFGKVCPYWDLCYSPRIAADWSEAFEPRMPNHPQEGRE